MQEPLVSIEDKTLCQFNCNDKKQGLPATRNMRTGAILNHVRVQAYAPPADRNRIFNALGGQVLRKYPIETVFHPLSGR